MMQVLKAGVLYFGLVFGAGFVLGTIRVLWVIPRLSVRTAELMEAPLMLGVTIAVARWVARRLHLPSSATARLGVGFTGLGFLLIAELGVALRLRGLTIREYVASRDPVSGTVYLVLLLLFALMPLLAAGR